MLNLDDPLDIRDIAFDWQLWDRDIFDDEHLIISHSNQRKSIRYVRKDVTVFISRPDIFGTYRLFSVSRATKVKLFDISSRGVLIAGPSRLLLKINQKIMLTLIFDSNKMFEFPAQVVRQLTEGRKLYGVKFDKVNDALGEYLLDSQGSFNFKL